MYHSANNLKIDYPTNIVTDILNWKLTPASVLLVLWCRKCDSSAPEQIK